MSSVNVLTAAGYWIAAFAFLVALILLLVSWEGRRTGIRLIAACAINVLWGAALGWDAGTAQISTGGLVLVEGLRSASWLVVVGAVGATGGTATYLYRLGLAGLLAAVAGGAIAASLQPPSQVFAWRFLTVAGLGTALIVIILLENAYRGAPAQARRFLQPLFVGLGGIYVYDLFAYSQAELLQRIPGAVWAARGFVNAFAAPLVILAARRNPAWSLNVFVSRQAIFYSGGVLAAGLYLLLVAAGGFAIREYGGQWGVAAEIVFLIAACLMLAMLVGSEVLRRRVQVFLSKHFYHNKYDYRAEWLRFVGTLAEAARSGGLRPALIRSVAQVIGSHWGTLWVRSDDERTFVAAAQWSDDGQDRGVTAALSAGDPLAQFLAARGWVIDVRRLRSTPEEYGGLRLPEAFAHHADLRLIAPVQHGAALVGIIALGEPAAPFKLGYEDIDLLRTIGHQVGASVAEIEAERRAAEGRQFEAYSRLVAFVMHDLKNLVAQLSLVLTNAQRHRQNPEFIDDTMDTIRNSASRMTHLIEQLNRGARPEASATFDLRDAAQGVCVRCADRPPSPQLDVPADPLPLRADPDRLAMALEHLVRNAQDATQSDGTVALRCSRDGGRILVQIADSGEGMSEEFIRDRLFRPFDSTKGAKGMGIGAYQAREYVRTLGGELHVSSAPMAGTVISIWLPLAGVPQA
jgi:putative PEP-CTERM system histidine kinase